MRNRGGSVKVCCRIKTPVLFQQRRGKSSRSKTNWERTSANKEKLMQLKAEMKEISEEQSSLKEQQRQVKEKFEAIESECRTLRREATLVMQKSDCTKLRLALMFQILKARENNDFAKAAHLTQSLRELITQEKSN